MKLKDLIKNKFEGFPRYRMSFYTQEDLPWRWEAGYDSVQFQKFSEEQFFEEVPLRTWLCTDTQVGLYAILWGGMFIALTHQPYRKSDKEWTFVGGFERFMYTCFKSYESEPVMMTSIPDDDEIFEMEFEPNKKYDWITGPIC